MMEILDHLHPEAILLQGGLWILILIVFLESGCFFGFFLPGDSLLFTAGVLCGSGIFHVQVEVLMAGLVVAGIVGYVTGYLFGKIIRINHQSERRLDHRKKASGIHQ